MQYEMYTQNEIRNSSREHFVNSSKFNQRKLTFEDFHLGDEFWIV